jgi:RNA polymerase sigma-70 factor (sigma-E family)
LSGFRDQASAYCSSEACFDYPPRSSIGHDHVTGYADDRVWLLSTREVRTRIGSAVAMVDGCRSGFQPSSADARLFGDGVPRRGAPVDDAGFAQFVEVRYVDLLKTAFLLTGSRHGAEDLVQSCLLKAMARWRDIEEPMAYLRRMMVNHHTSLWRRLRRELLSAQPPERGTDDPTGVLADRATLVAELARLPRQMRSVLVLRYWEDLSEADTAMVLDCSVGTVKSQASRGLARLRGVFRETAAAVDAETAQGGRQ